MKEQLEAIWHDRKVRCPLHWVWWNAEHGYQEGVGLFFTKGHITKRYPQQRIGSFLCKNYGAVWRMYQVEAKKLTNCNCAQLHPLPVWYCSTHGEVTVPMD